jgi:hypothetical protein
MWLVAVWLVGSAGSYTYLIPNQYSLPYLISSTASSEKRKKERKKERQKEERKKEYAILLHVIITCTLFLSINNVI